MAEAAWGIAGFDVLAWRWCRWRWRLYPRCGGSGRRGWRWRVQFRQSLDGYGRHPSGCFIHQRGDGWCWSRFRWRYGRLRDFFHHLGRPEQQQFEHHLDHGCGPNWRWNWNRCRSRCGRRRRGCLWCYRSFPCPWGIQRPDRAGGYCRWSGRRCCRRGSSIAIGHRSYHGRNGRRRDDLGGFCRRPYHAHYGCVDFRLRAGQCGGRF